MNDLIDLNPQIIDRLKHEFQMVEQGIYLRGRCPECEKKTLWTWLEKPGHVQCDRKNSCNYEEKTFDLFPDLFEKINEKYQATEANPTATADAYLSLIRGFNPTDIKGWYEQGKYWHPKGNKGTATVRFFLDADKAIMWERLIEDVTITDEDGNKETRNKNFKGAFKGHWWQPPTLIINEGDEVWLCEGILDAIALNLSGIKSVAIMSSGTFPDANLKPYLNKNITWIIATDNDAAGRNALQKHAKRLREMGESVTGALSSSFEAKSDWNDLYKAGKLTETDINKYRYLGRVELAQSYREKAQMMWENNTNRHYFVFAYRRRTYSIMLDKKEYDKAAKDYWAGTTRKEAYELHDDDLEKLKKEASPQQHKTVKEYAFNQGAKIKEIATFDMSYLYFQQPDNGETGQYYFKFGFANNAPSEQYAFEGKTFGGASDFKKAVLNVAPGALFTGTTLDLETLYKEWNQFNIKRVRSLDFVGYDRASKAYVYSDFAAQDGKVLKLNKEHYFELKKEGVKSVADIRQNLTDSYNPSWVSDYYTAFQTKGLVALTWWFGTLFVEQVYQQTSSYPWLAIIGEAGSGKTDMTDFLWKLLGKESDSFNPAISTLPARSRKLAEVSNMPVMFNEVDNEAAVEDKHIKRFAWNDMKGLYNGQIDRATAIKSQNNVTKKPRFKAGLCAVQNIPIIAATAIMTRICHLQFDKDHHSLPGKDALDRLKEMPIKDVSGFLLHCVTKADRVMKYFTEKNKQHYATLMQIPEIKEQRIKETHAKLMAFADCLGQVIPEIDKFKVTDIHNYIIKMAHERQESLNEDHPLVQQFWGQFEYLDSKPTFRSESGQAMGAEHQMNHSNTPSETIAINLEHFHSQCRLHHLPVIETKELRRHLQTSKQRKYLRNGPIHSRLENRSVRCWEFKR